MPTSGEWFPPGIFWFLWGRLLGKNFFEKPTLEGVEINREIIVFIGERYFLKTIFLGENFFVMPTFASHFFKSIFWGKKFMTIFAFSQGHFLKSIFLGKKFMTNCSPFIGKKPRGPAGEGVQGRVWGSTWGHMPGQKWKSPRSMWQVAPKAHPCSAHPR